MPKERSMVVGRRARRSGIAAVAAFVLLMVAEAAGPSAADASPPRTETVEIGRSAQGRPIVAVHRWRPGADTRLLVVGNLHGNEPAGLAVVERLRTVRLPAGVDLWLLPTANPDGNQRRTRVNARGVDLNRNFPHRWLLAGHGTRMYSGPSVASEPETRALAGFVRQRRPHTTVVFHQPLYGVDGYQARSPALVRALSRATGLPVRDFRCGGVCHGTFTGWHNSTAGGNAVTVEFGATVSNRQLDRAADAVLEAGTAY